MRTVHRQTDTSPSIFLAIESSDCSERLEAGLSQLGCECSKPSGLTSFEHLLKNETPSLVVISLEIEGKCALQYCQDHPLLLDEIPVFFLAADPSHAFEKAMQAIRLGALDVLTLPLDNAKLEKIASVAHQRSKAWEPRAEADFFVNNLPYSVQDLPEQPSAELPTGEQEVAFEASPLLHSNSCNGLSPSSTFSNSRPFSASLHASKPVVNEKSVSPTSPELRFQKAGHAARVKELEGWILGSSPAMQAVRSIIAEVAETKANVMISGASGTGKELVATAVHKLSNRSKGPFEPVNMTEIPHELAESLLFGHEKGSFTGAENLQIGVCEAADGGTLFLDEIGEMPIATQPKLLRFLQESTVKRVGSRTNKKVDVRVITATNRNPDTIVKEGLMREDLFFRLHVVPIYIPPLKSRPEDIEQLALLFLRRYVNAYSRPIEGFTNGALDIFRSHDWPGNVRQLENVVERLVVFAKGRLIDVPDIPAEIHAISMFEGTPNSGLPGRFSQVFTKAEALEAHELEDETALAVASMSAMQRTERSAIIEALRHAGGHVIDAANLLGLGQATVYRKIKLYHIPHQRRRRRRTPK